MTLKPPSSPPFPLPKPPETPQPHIHLQPVLHKCSAEEPVEEEHLPDHVDEIEGFADQVDDGITTVPAVGHLHVPGKISGWVK